MTAIRSRRPHIPVRQPKRDELDRRRDEPRDRTVTARELLQRDEFDRSRRPSLFPPASSLPQIPPPPSEPVLEDQPRVRGKPPHDTRPAPPPPPSEPPAPSTPPPAGSEPTAPAPILPPIVELPEVPPYLAPPGSDQPISPPDDGIPELPPYLDLPREALPEAGDTARSLVEGGTVSRALADAGVKSPEEAQRVLDFGAKVLGKSEQQVANLLRRASANPGQRALLEGLVSGAAKAVNGSPGGGVGDVAEGIQKSWDALSAKERSELTKAIIAQTKSDPRLGRMPDHLDALVEANPEAGRGALEVIAGALHGDGAAVNRGLEAIEGCVFTAHRNRDTSGQRHFNLVREAMLATLPLDQRREVVRETASRVTVHIGYGRPSFNLDGSERADQQPVPSLLEFLGGDSAFSFHAIDHAALAEAFAARFPSGG